MRFKFEGENFDPPFAPGLLAALDQANKHFGDRLPFPGMWMDGPDEPNGYGGTTSTFYWAEGNFSD